ncbi:abc transporter, atp-binding protein [hydrocarbon metagenome]|uniref:Abc transporter, atp-binding protein n=1 Tax=hydrocarbon metagenome TaxID=938273 RepID=A0A0W8E4C0_9ZZZZ
MTAFRIDNLVKGYPKSSFKLRIKQFSLPQGSIMGLLGVNGAGKTSLLKLLIQITFPDEGTVTWSKNVSLASDFIVNNVSYMPEYKNLYHNLSVGSMLRFSSRTIPGWNNLKAETLLSVFPLDLGKKISTLSYGEKIRLYGVITFSKDVPYIILDEPSRGLDPVMQDRMLEQVKLASQEGKTIVFSSHQLQEIEETADSTAIIKNGEIILYDYLDDLKSSLFLLAAPDGINIPSEEASQLVILARRRQSGQDILLCRGTESTRPSLGGPARVFDVNLKDIFLTINEGEVYQ